MAGGQPGRTFRNFGFIRQKEFFITTAEKAFLDALYLIKLGSIVDINARDYYVQNRFSYLIERLNAIASSVTP